MASLIKLTDTDVIKEQVADFITKRRFPKLINEAKEIMQPKLVRACIDAFHRTIFWQGMTGRFAGDRALDVQAHFGLEDGDAKQAAQEISDSIEQSLELKQITGLSKSGLFAKLGSSAQIVFNIGSPTLIKNIRSAVTRPSYTSNTGTQIEWLEWALGQDSDIRMGISFNPAVVGEHNSRTGRAVMIWSSPSYAWHISRYNYFSKSGINFIEDMLEDTQFVDECADIIVNSIKEVAEQ